MALRQQSINCLQVTEPKPNMSRIEVLGWTPARVIAVVTFNPAAIWGGLNAAITMINHF
jgi:hypothetical protein